MIDALSSSDIAAIWLTLKLAAVSTAILLIIGIPLAWRLSHSTSTFKPLFEAMIALPLVLPPTVIGFYLLISFSPASFVGETWEVIFGSRLAFSFTALVIGSVIYSLPFVVQPLKNTFDHLPYNILEAAATMGASPWDQARHVVLPLSRSGIIGAALLGFAHTIGEFGIVLMIGGNIPGETQVLSIALYDRVEALEYGQAHGLAAGLLLFSFMLLAALYSMQRSKPKEKTSWA